MIPVGPFWYPPTASQNRATGHETPSSAGETAGVVSLAGLGVACFCHAAPFQVSASVSVMPEVLRNEPTAVHEVADRQDTDLVSPPGNVTLGEFRMVQVVLAANAAPVGAMAVATMRADTASATSALAAPAPQLRRHIATPR